jgi:hypothetical protein
VYASQLAKREFVNENKKFGVEKLVVYIPVNCAGT